MLNKAKYFGRSLKAQKWVLTSNFKGEPKESDMQLQEEAIPDLKDGDILLEGECWSVDPYMRPLSDDLPPGTTMVGQQLAKVVMSKNTQYPEGKYLLANVGWRTHTVCNPDKLPPMSYQGWDIPSIVPIPDTGNLPKSVTLGALGMPGAAAYLGLMNICEPQSGETVLVNGAAGAVGSLVGQIAKIKGCKAIGFAGSDEKVQFIKELGFDAAFNYKKVDVNSALKEAAPQGIDCYFDNVGGDFSNTVVVNHMNRLGRISVCGCISKYNDGIFQGAHQAPELFPFILGKQLVMQGFIVFRWINQYAEAQEQILQWIQEGKIQYKEHVTDGFENMRSAFYGVLKGDNIGKAIIRNVDTR